MSLARLLEPVEIGLVVLGVEEDSLPVVPALDDMNRNAWKKNRVLRGIARVWIGSLAQSIA